MSKERETRVEGRVGGLGWSLQDMEEGQFCLGVALFAYDGGSHVKPNEQGRLVTTTVNAHEVRREEILRFASELVQALYKLEVTAALMPPDAGEPANEPLEAGAK